MFYEWIINYILLAVFIDLNVYRNRVEARHAIVPLSNYFSSRESIQLKNAYVTTIPPDYYDNNRAEYFYRHPKHGKKSKHKKNSHTIDNDVKIHKKRLKPKRKFGNRFVKTSLRGRDSNISDSKELEKGKPVDIIVHIKMND